MKTMGQEAFSDTMRVVLRTYVHIPPVELHGKWRDFVISELHRLYKNSCIPYNGFITDIYGIRRFDDMMITSTTGNVLCQVDFDAAALFPSVGTRIQTLVDSISPHGVLLSHPYMTIIIPARQMRLDGYEMRSSFSSSSVFVSPDHPTVAMRQLVTTELTHVRFENHAFSAVGKLIAE